MSDHMVELLGAYLDGELNNGQLRKVEAHLSECLACQEEVEALQALSGMLQETPLPEFPSPEQLAANVALHLPRKPIRQPIPRRIIEFGWWMAPVGLIVAWIFISATILVDNLVGTASGFGLLESTSAWFGIGTSSAANYSALLGRFGLLDLSNLQWLTAAESFARRLISSIFWQVAIAMLYLSWIAIWWARRTHRGLGQPLES